MFPSKKGVFPHMNKQTCDVHCDYFDVQSIIDEIGSFNDIEIVSVLKLIDGDNAPFIVDHFLSNRA